MLFYVLFPSLFVGGTLALLLRGARRKWFPFSLVDEVPIEKLDLQLDNGVFACFASFLVLNLVMTLVQVLSWPHSFRYAMVNVFLVVGCVGSLWLFLEGRWSRVVASRAICCAHFVFMVVGAFVSSHPSLTVVFDYYAMPVMFGNLAILATEQFAFGMLLLMGVYLTVTDYMQLQFAGAPWFDFASMKADSQMLPFLMALANLVQLCVRRLAAVYKAQRLTDHFATLDKSKDDFLRSVAHEIKSPLHGIIGCAQLLSSSSNENLTPDQQQQISVILHCSAVLNLLVDNVLSLGHEGIRHVPWEQTCLRPYFENVLGLLKNLVYGQSMLMFDLHLSETLPVSAEIPCSMLTPVLLNLGLNAVKHAASGQEVVISVAFNGHELL